MYEGGDNDFIRAANDAGLDVDWIKLGIYQSPGYNTVWLYDGW